MGIGIEENDTLYGAELAEHFLRKGKLIEHWLCTKKFIRIQGGWGIAWEQRSGYDFTCLEFRDIGDGLWDTIVGHHVSGMNPRMRIGRCSSLADVQRTYHAIRLINGYPGPDED